MRMNERKAKLAMQWMQGFLSRGPATKATIKEHFPFEDKFLDIALSVAWRGGEKEWHLQDSDRKTIFWP